MEAIIAEASEHDVLVDREGTLWVRDGSRWAYVNGPGSLTGQLGWDRHNRLPVEYQPYVGLDTAATVLVRAAVKFD